ncbi:DUF6397 family protein [Streptomyces poriferorum]|uniref:DUF6397 family protein n=1 Tax=Streptomyces poriferorum TaxID=2798799 RepID=A0ABY9IGC0_9ACTN|nr:MULTISPECIES: DUF6397 family protein [Streptomyces]MDP5315913.1 DUF6397 family protein [Streptomyces sp. Alt4]WLQ54260.1 DUF6397 family protein [Streptomyces sp. Alt2]
MPMTGTVRDNGVHMITASSAAAELELRRGEFALAVHLGIVRVGARQSGGRAGVHREEIDRLRSEDGFPGTLQERVRTVGTADGARLLGISPVRFSRLARAGCVTPVAFYLNRYRAVVWLYLAQELGGLAARSPELMVGNSPPWMRSRLDAGTDCRARNWRARRTERLLALTEDPWARAAVVGEALDPVQLAEVVDDPYERAYLGRVRPVPVFGQGGSAAGREAMAQLMLADEPDEILWRRVTLGMELDGARELRAAPRPGEERCPGSTVDSGASAEPAVPVWPFGPVRRSGAEEASAERPESGTRGDDAQEDRTQGDDTQEDRTQEDCTQEDRTQEGSEREAGGGDGAAGLLARFRLRRTPRRRSARRTAGGRGKRFAAGARTRHSLHHADQGSHR